VTSRRVRTSAKMKSFQANTKVKTAVANRPARHREGDLAQHLEARAGVDGRALLELDRGKSCQGNPSPRLDPKDCGEADFGLVRLA
jgi:hypothetical protein